MHGSDWFLSERFEPCFITCHPDMKRLFFFFIILFAGLYSAYAAGFPKLSSGSQEYWYYLKFTQGTFVVASNGDGEVCKSLVPTGKGAQLWKVEGSSSVGYTFTNKLGLKLYVTGTSEGSEVRAAAVPPSLERFKINASGSNYTITPFSNTGLSFNAWGGMGIRNDIKLYNSSDANAPMAFVTVEDMVVKGAEIKVVPYPSSLTMGEGVYDLHKLKGIEVPQTSIAVPSGFPQNLSSPLILLANRLKEDLYRTAAIDVKIKTDMTEEWMGLAMSVDDKLGEEAYRLTISTDGIILQAADYGGFFNAVQTLRQLMPAAIFGQDAALDAAWVVPCLTIEDAPAMHHRGFHLDISRHFFDKQEVKKLLDMASVYKLNRFHWHLTDDQGWRVEIPEYPKLTTVGAIRKASLIVSDQSGDRFFDDTEYGRGCYYTLDDLREIVAYAAERNIQIIPEIDMPGHMTACIVAYPNLGCNPEKKIEVMTEGGVSRDILNIGKTETIDFLKCVLGHIAEVFPYELMHLGGDECPTSAWENNADCQRLIKQEGLSGVGGLQPWLVEKLGSFLRDKYGKTVLVWDELLANWNNAYTVKPVVMSWRGVDYARQAADRGLYSIMVPTSPLYFDYMQVNRDQLEIDCPYNAPYGTINTVEKVYNFDPRSTVSGREKYVLGTQANLWTESCSSNREAEYQYYPRLLALSEIAWLPTSKKSFVGFYCRLQEQAAILKAKNITYAPHYFEPAELTPAEAAIAEAEDILAHSIPGTVGYPKASYAVALRSAIDALKGAIDNPSSLSTLQTQLSAYKSAPIVLPEAGKFYKIESASTYYRYRFDGSSLYAKGTSLAIHYTQQTEQEELWQFQPQEDGSYQVVNVNTGNAIRIPTVNGTEAKADQPQGSNVTICKATKPAGGFTYIPGVVNIKNGRLNLFAKLSGRTLTITASPDSTLCYPGTWRIVEVTDYRPWLEKLLVKCEVIQTEANPGAVGQPTEEAMQLLINEIIGPARECLAQDEVSQEEYLRFSALYDQFQGMTVEVLDGYDLSYYYLIRNAYHRAYYAVANAAGNGVVHNQLTGDYNDSFLWSFVRNDDGTVSISNKQTCTTAFTASEAEDQRIRLGKPYSWTLKQVTTDLGDTGIGIINCTGTISWYINPSSWSYALLKPYEWGAAIWEFIKTEQEVLPDAIQDVKDGNLNENVDIYDLSGRRVNNGSLRSLKKGVYIHQGRKWVW